MADQRPVSRALAHPVCDAFGQVFREAREARGLWKYRVEKRSGCSRAMIGRVEMGRSVPTLDRAARICAALGLALAPVIAEAEARSGGAAQG